MRWLWFGHGAGPAPGRCRRPANRPVHFAPPEGDRIRRPPDEERPAHDPSRHRYARHRTAGGGVQLPPRPARGPDRRTGLCLGEDGRHGDAVRARPVHDDRASSPTGRCGSGRTRSPRPRVESDDTGYELYVRVVPIMRFTTLLWRLPVGHQMRMIGPKGKFMLDPDDDRTHLYISTGTGIAPFISMIRQTLANGDPAQDDHAQRRVRTSTSSGTARSWRRGARWRVPGQLRPDDLAARGSRAMTGGRAGPAASRRTSSRSPDEFDLDPERHDRLHLRQPGDDPHGRGDAPGARVPGGATSRRSFTGRRARWSRPRRADPRGGSRQLRAAAITA